MKRWIFGSCVCVLALIGLTGCAYNEATDSKQFNWISEEKEIKLGADAHKQIVKEYGLYKDDNLTAYVNTVGQRVAKASGRPHLTYHFSVLDSPVVNAFALPGGYVYVTRGILVNMNSEAELAFVLGHEVGHVAAKHGAQRMTQAQSIGALLTAASVLLDSNAVNQYGGIVSKAVELSVLGYGRKNEHESDALGVEYALDAGYDPKAGSRFLETLKKQSSYKDDLLTRLQSSHPPTDERIQQVGDQLKGMETEHPLPKGLDVNSDSFLTHIEGVFVGEAPLVGKREKSDYINLQLEFKMTIPESWSVFGLMDEPIVGLEHKNGTRGYIYKKALLKGETLSEFKARFKDKEELDLDAIKSTTGIPIERTTVRNDTLTHITYYTLRENSGLLFYFQIPLALSETRVDIESMMKTLSALSSEEQKDVKRLVVHVVAPGETITSIAKQYFGTEDRAAELADFNQLSAGSPLIPGSKLKLNP